MSETTSRQAYEVVPEPEPGSPALDWVRWHYARSLAMRKTTMDHLAGTRRYGLHMVAIEAGLLELAVGYLLDAANDPTDGRSASELYADLYELQEAADEIGPFLWGRLRELGVDAETIGAWTNWVAETLRNSAEATP